MTYLTSRKEVIDLGLFDKIGDFISSSAKSLKKGLTSTIGSIPSLVTGGLADFGANLLGNEFIAGPNAAEQYKYNEALSEAAFQRSYDLYKRRYRITLKDMEKAGLNPILALAGGGFTVSGQPQMSAASTSMPSFQPSNGSSAFANMEAGKLDAARTDTEKENRKKVIAETSAKIQDVAESIERIYNLRAQRKVLKQEETVKFRTVQKLKQEYHNAIAQYNLIWNQADLAYQQGKLTKQQLSMIAAQRKQVLTVTNKLEHEIDMLRRVADVYRGPAGKWLGYVKAIKDVMPVSGFGLGMFKKFGKGGN